MADFADIGTDATEAAINDAILRQQKAAASTEPMKANGTCHNPRCADDTDGLFCNAKCRDEYEYILKRRTMQ